MTPHEAHEVEPYRTRELCDVFRIVIVYLMFSKAVEGFPQMVVLEVVVRVHHRDDADWALPSS